MINISVFTAFTFITPVILSLFSFSGVSCAYFLQFFHPCL